MYRFITGEQLVVLYGKSGLGKSSLLNAGLMPMVRAKGNLEPLSFRFGAYNEDNKLSPLSSSKEGLSNGVVSVAVELEKIKPSGEDSLWFHLKNRQLSGGAKGYLLIFDQFEELFTYPKEAVQAFGQQLSELLFTTIPEHFRVNLEAGLKSSPDFLTEKEMQRLHQPFDLRIVMAIRSDRMSLMNQLKPFLPNILQNCFELRSLTVQEAESAILSPAYLPQEVGPFDTPVFDYEDAAVASLIDFLSENHTQEIESFQLQILCEYVERYVVLKKGKNLVSQQDIARPELILENYYLDKINELPEADRLPARQLIEEGLVFEEEERRLSLYEGQIARNYGISNDLLAMLLNTHLIRSEPSLRGGYTYELSHDTLVSPVLKAKAKRLEGERLEAARKAQQLKEEEMAELRRVAEEERLKTLKERELKEKAQVSETRARHRTRIAMVTSAFAIAVSILAFTMYKSVESTKNDLTIVQNKLKLTKAQISGVVLNDVGIHIKNFDYDSAYILLNWVASLDTLVGPVSKAYLEIAFWYGETGQTEKAIGILDSAAVILNKDIPSVSLGDTPTQEQLRQSIEKLDSSQYKFLIRRYYPHMVYIKGDTFQMGCNPDKLKKVKGWGDKSCNGNLHTVILGDYYIAETETTWWQFKLYRTVTSKLDVFKGRPSWSPTGDHPVVNVSWYDAIGYANWVSQHSPQLSLDTVYIRDTLQAASWVADSTKNGFRLPTEAEWEFAANSGGENIFSGTSSSDSLFLYGNYASGKNADSTLYDGYPYTSPSKYYRPNSWNLYDMSGNVSEWCWDWYSSGYYEEGQNNPWGPATAKERVRRGGSWKESFKYLACAYRNSRSPEKVDSSIGFRLAKTAN